MSHSGHRGVVTFNDREGDVTLTNDDLTDLLEKVSTTTGIAITDHSEVGITISELGWGGISLVDASINGILLEEQDSGGITVRDHSTARQGIQLVETGNGPIRLSGAAGVEMVAPDQPISFYTAATRKDLPMPEKPPAFAFLATGHICFFPVGGEEWSLISRRDPVGS